MEGDILRVVDEGGPGALHLRKKMDPDARIFLLIKRAKWAAEMITSRLYLRANLRPSDEY
jgi:hypothetical protein